MLIKCADDFGLTKDINTTIINLAKARKITHASCMVNFDRPNDFKILSKIDGLKLGLHFCITGQMIGPCSGSLKSLTDENNYFYSWKQFLKKVLLKQIDASEISLELHEQINRFTKLLGRPPSYLDSHHHTHQLPIVSDVVINVKKNYSSIEFIRNSAKFYSDTGNYMNQLVFKSIGRYFRKKLDNNNIATNSTLYGALNAHCPLDVYKKAHSQNKNTDFDILVLHPGKSGDKSLLLYEPKPFNRELDTKVLELPMPLPHAQA